jgi:hypothetical protein
MIGSQISATVVDTTPETAAQPAAEADVPQTLEQQETMVIKGPEARQMVMQKLMRQTEVIFPTDFLVVRVDGVNF